MNSPRGDRSAPATVLAIAALTTPALGFFLPIFGVLLSLGAAFFAAARAGTLLWRATGRMSSHLGVATSGFAALWLPGALQLTGVLHRLLGPQDDVHIGATAWLLLPLGAPENPWLPGAVATMVYTLGATVSAVAHRPWPWIIGGLAASLAYDLTIEIASIESIS